MRQIIKAALTVVVPSEDGGEGKEYQTHHQKEGRYAFLERQSHLESLRRNLDTLQTVDLPGTHDDDGKPGHGADNQGIDDGSQHRNQALAYRLIGFGCSRRNRSTAQPGFVGKDTAGNSLLHGHHHGTECSACRCAKSEGTLNNFSKGSRNFRQMSQNDNQRDRYINNSHKRNNFFRHKRNPPQSANNNHGNADGQEQSGDHRADRVCMAEHVNRGFRFRVKEVLNCTGNPVDLGKRTDTEKADQKAKEGENLRQPFPLFSHSVFNIIERTSDDMSVGCFGTEFHCEHTLCIFGCRADKSCHPHPEKSARSAGCDGCGDAHDISGSDRCRQRRAQGLKACDVTAVLRFAGAFL